MTSNSWFHYSFWDCFSLFPIYLILKFVLDEKERSNIYLKGLTREREITFVLLCLQDFIIGHQTNWSIVAHKLWPLQIIFRGIYWIFVGFKIVERLLTEFCITFDEFKVNESRQSEWKQFLIILMSFQNATFLFFISSFSINSKLPKVYIIIIIIIYWITYCISNACINKNGSSFLITAIT